MNLLLNWHKMAFPDITKEEQIKKLKEEIEEWEAAESIEDKIKESADVMIVGQVLTLRFNVQMKDLTEFKEQLIKIDNFIGEHSDECQRAFSDKLLVNSERKWAKSSDGVWRHLEESEQNVSDVKFAV